MDQNQAVTLDDVRREVADMLSRRERAAAEMRRERSRELRWAEDKFRGDLIGYVGGAVMAFVACWLLCGVLLVLLAPPPPGPGAFIFISLAPFALWLAGAAVYARRRFGPGRGDDDGGVS